MGSKTQNILVVDDDRVLVKSLESLLVKQGFNVLVAYDGIEAMVQVKKHMVDLIVLDIMMPEINGYDVCRSLKFDSPYKNIPIVLMTSRDQEIDPHIGQMMGIHYLQKPLDNKVFLSKIAHVLK